MGQRAGMDLVICLSLLHLYRSKEGKTQSSRLHKQFQLGWWLRRSAAGRALVLSKHPGVFSPLKPVQHRDAGRVLLRWAPIDGTPRMAAVQGRVSDHSMSAYSTDLRQGST